MTTLGSNEGLITILRSVALKLAAKILHGDMPIADDLGGKKECTMVQTCNLELLTKVTKEGNIDRIETVPLQSKSLLQGINDTSSLALS
jgi:hypothetical protein